MPVDWERNTYESIVHLVKNENHRDILQKPQTVNGEAVNLCTHILWITDVTIHPPLKT